MIRQAGIRQVQARRVGADPSGAAPSTLTFSNGVTLTGSNVTNDLITGKAGGQTIIGGTAAGENLQLQSTSNATRGLLLLNDPTRLTLADATTTTAPDQLVIRHTTSGTAAVGFGFTLAGELQSSAGTTRRVWTDSTAFVVATDAAEEVRRNFSLIVAGASQPCVSFGFLINGNNPTLYLGDPTGGPIGFVRVPGASQMQAVYSTAQMSWNGSGTTSITQHTFQANTVFAPTATGSGVLTKIAFTPSADTGTTASTEAFDVNFDLSRTRTWATGALATQRAIRIKPPTYAFVGASTITSAATLALEGAPIAGANATITAAYSLWTQSGTVRNDLADAATTTAPDLVVYRHTTSGTAAVGYGYTIAGELQSAAGNIRRGLTDVLSLQVATDGAEEFRQTVSLMVAGGLQTWGAFGYRAAGNFPAVFLGPASDDTTLGRVGSVLQVTVSATLAQQWTATSVTASQPFAVTPAVTTSGVVSKFRVVPLADTGTTASTEAFDADFDLSRTRTWATGALATQRAIRIKPPTYAFVGASTITTTATMAIEGAPIAGANATLTTTLALWVQAGTTRLDGGLLTPTITGQTTPFGSLQLIGTSNASTGAVYTLDSFGVGRVPGLNVPPKFAIAGNVTVASAASATLSNIIVNQPTITVTGATNITTALGFNLFEIQPPAIVTTVSIGQGVGFIPGAATLVINGPPTISGGGTITGTFGAVALWVQNPTIGGTSAMFDGSVGIGSSAGSTASLYLLGSGGINITASTTLILGSANASQSIIKSGSSGDLVINNSNAVGAVILQGGNVEAFRILGTATAGRIQFASSAMAANGAVATAMSSLGPAGSHTTIQEWLTFFNASGTQRWVPCF